MNRFSGKTVGFSLFKTVVLILFTLLLSFTVQAQIRHLIFFGDSLSDSGNNFWVKSGGPHQGAPITNRSATGERRIWTEYFTRIFEDSRQGGQARSLQVSSKAIHPGIHLNYAWASAETGRHYLSDNSGKPYFPSRDNECRQPGLFADSRGEVQPCVPSVGLQVQQFIQQHGKDPEYIKSSLVVMLAGGNDILNNLGKLLSENRLKILLTQGLSHPIDNTLLNIKVLHRAGVPYSNMLVLGLPDFSLIPAIHKLVNNNASALSMLSQISSAYNRWLQFRLWWETLFSDQAITFYNPTSFLNDLAVNGSYETIDGASLEFSQGLIPCHQKPEEPERPGCDQHIFYNLKHPSSQAHRAFADDLWRHLLRQKPLAAKLSS
ncbi:SGNH/GDSL hydrolase family protein [Dongshaea marina]|uniref:SGNH/GDSL hydrolase family protein n=1 Tax=Dongshaea marina TaxID=2047966 RepID=UPI000D3EC49F|nr:SGNH/GDSL hydrolase family protein [Dongshaea marina]